MKDKPVPSHLKKKKKKEKKSSMETEQENMAKRCSSVLNIFSSHVAYYSS